MDVPSDPTTPNYLFREFENRNQRIFASLCLRTREGNNTYSEIGVGLFFLPFMKIKSCLWG